MNRFLRSLSPDQQLSLLFVALFGTLLLASSAVFLLSMRERPDGDPVTLRLKRVRNGLQRTWVMMGLIWLALALGKVGALWLFAVASLLALREFVSLTPTRRGDHKALLLAYGRGLREVSEAEVALAVRDTDGAVQGATAPWLRPAARIAAMVVGIAAVGVGAWLAWQAWGGGR